MPLLIIKFIVLDNVVLVKVKEFVILAKIINFKHLDAYVLLVNIIVIKYLLVVSHVLKVVHHALALTLINAYLIYLQREMVKQKL